MIAYFTAKPRMLFLLDSLGALLSAIFLFVVPRNFNANFGMPDNILLWLSAIAATFCISSALCFTIAKENYKWVLKVIGITNLLYCMLTLSLLTIHRSGLTSLAICYFLLEMMIVCGLVFIELRTAAVLQKQYRTSEKMKHKNDHTDAIILPEGQGRVYNCGTMTAIFKADENETSENYSVSEWWLAPNSDGPGAHLHEENDEVFYILEGTLSFLVGDKWVDADKGTFLRIPAKTIHDFKNKTSKRSGALNFFIPGGFERNMPSIVKWFEENK